MMRTGSLIAMTLVLSLSVGAQDGRDGKDGGKPDRPARASGGNNSSSKPDDKGQPEPRKPEQPPRKQEPQRPLVIRMGQPQGRDVRKNNDPSVPRPQPRSAPKPRPYQAPAYGQVRWQNTTPAASAPLARPGAQPRDQSAPVPARPAPAGNEARAISHHPYTQGYVRQRLQKIGVKSEPGFIVDRSEMVIGDRKNSVPPRPERGWNNQELRAKPIGPHRFDVDVVRNHMTRVGRPEFMERIHLANERETERDRYYWHRDQGFEYSHYVDGSGFQWYGWYVGTDYFWTRYNAGRWWWYDTGFGRWCFWNDNFWWWQDPNHVGDLYCYHDSSYIPVNSADDQIDVDAPAQPDSTVFKSPDGSRVVKIASESKDAFLYDAAVPPEFTPKYLASGVVSVEYSDPGTGRPLEIVLKLDDGTFDLLDADGEPYVAPASRSINSY
jgi:hypothetical protein